MSVRVRFVGSGDAFGSGGRFQTCILVDAPGARVLLDCGASSLVALRQQGIDPAGVDAVVLSHLHGDHCGGIPFLLLDAIFASKRARPLTIAGPPGSAPRLRVLLETMFPGSGVMRPHFGLSYLDLEPRRRQEVVPGVTVTTFPARHAPESDPSLLRVECGGKSITFTGDTDWTPELVEASRGTDLLIAECYAYDRPVKLHMAYTTLRPRLGELQARRVVLTHLSPEMLRRLDEIDVPCAHDGMVIEV